MNTPLISVIMSVYNEKTNWVKEAIDSILNQTYTNLEFIIIIDDPKQFDLINLVKHYKDADSRVKYYINRKNEGLIYSLNLALKHSNGEFIARMDADDISHTNRLEKQLAFLLNNNLDLIGSNINLFKNDKEIFFTTQKLQTHKYLKKMLQYGAIGIVHPTFFGRSHVFNTLKGYSKALHVEDMEFLARVFYHGFKVGNSPDVLLDCRYSESSVTKTKALYIDKIGRYVTKVFKCYVKTGTYHFDENYYKTIKLNNRKATNYNRRQILMGEARESLTNKNYTQFVLKLLNSFWYSFSVLTNLKVNFILKTFVLLEKWK